MHTHKNPSLLKIISILIAEVFLASSLAYSAPLPQTTHLRKELDFSPDNKISSGQRMGEVMGHLTEEKANASGNMLQATENTIASNTTTKLLKLTARLRFRRTEQVLNSRIEAHLQAMTDSLEQLFTPLTPEQQNAITIDNITHILQQDPETLSAVYASMGQEKDLLLKRRVAQAITHPEQTHAAFERYIQGNKQPDSPAQACEDVSIAIRNALIQRGVSGDKMELLYIYRKTDGTIEYTVERKENLAENGYQDFVHVALLLNTSDEPLIIDFTIGQFSSRYIGTPENPAQHVCVTTRNNYEKTVFPSAIEDYDSNPVLHDKNENIAHEARFRLLVDHISGTREKEFLEIPLSILIKTINGRIIAVPSRLKKIVALIKKEHNLTQKQLALVETDTKPYQETLIKNEIAGLSWIPISHPVVIDNHFTSKQSQLMIDQLKDMLAHERIISPECIGITLFGSVLKKENPRDLDGHLFIDKKILQQKILSRHANKTQEKIDAWIDAYIQQSVNRFTWNSDSFTIELSPKLISTEIIDAVIQSMEKQKEHTYIKGLNMVEPLFYPSLNSNLNFYRKYVIKKLLGMGDKGQEIWLQITSGMDNWCGYKCLSILDQANDHKNMPAILPSQHLASNELNVWEMPGIEGELLNILSPEDATIIAQEEERFYVYTLQKLRAYIANNLDFHSALVEAWYEARYNKKLSVPTNKLKFSLEEAIDFFECNIPGVVIELNEDITQEMLKKHAPQMIANEISFFRMRGTKEWIAIRGAGRTTPIAEISDILEKTVDRWIHNHLSDNRDYVTPGDVFYDYALSFAGYYCASLVLIPSGMGRFTSAYMDMVKHRTGFGNSEVDKIVGEIRKRLFNEHHMKITGELDPENPHVRTIMDAAYKRLGVRYDFRTWDTLPSDDALLPDTFQLYKALQATNPAIRSEAVSFLCKIIKNKKYILESQTMSDIEKRALADQIKHLASIVGKYAQDPDIYIQIMLVSPETEASFPHDEMIEIFNTFASHSIFSEVKNLAKKGLLKYQQTSRKSASNPLKTRGAKNQSLVASDQGLVDQTLATSDSSTNLADRQRLDTDLQAEQLTSNPFSELNMNGAKILQSITTLLVEQVENHTHKDDPTAHATNCIAVWKNRPPSSGEIGVFHRLPFTKGDIRTLATYLSNGPTLGMEGIRDMADIASFWAAQLGNQQDIQTSEFSDKTIVFSWHDIDYHQKGFQETLAKIPSGQKIVVWVSSDYQAMSTKNAISQLPSSQQEKISVEVPENFRDHFEDIFMFKGCAVKNNTHAFRFMTLDAIEAFDAELKAELEHSKAQSSTHTTPQNSVPFGPAQNAIIENIENQIRQTIEEHYEIIQPFQYRDNVWSKADLLLQTIASALDTGKETQCATRSARKKSLSTKTTDGQTLEIVPKKSAPENIGIVVRVSPNPDYSVTISIAAVDPTNFSAVDSYQINIEISPDIIFGGLTNMLLSNVWLFDAREMIENSQTWIDTYNDQVLQNYNEENGQWHDYFLIITQNDEEEKQLRQIFQGTLILTKTGDTQTIKLENDVIEEYKTMLALKLGQKNPEGYENVFGDLFNITHATKIPLINQLFLSDLIEKWRSKHAALIQETVKFASNTQTKKQHLASNGENKVIRHTSHVTETPEQIASNNTKQFSAPPPQIWRAGSAQSPGKPEQIASNMQETRWTRVEGRGAKNQSLVARRLSENSGFRG